MTFLLASGIGVLAGCGVWLLLRARTFDAVLGLTMLGYAVNLFIFAMGRIGAAGAPIVAAGEHATLQTHADPLPQALVLTAIVIGFALTAVLIALAVRAHAHSGSDHVDGGEAKP
jgi:multicomponent K+:H+ antiporter subunit C